MNRDAASLWEDTIHNRRWTLIWAALWLSATLALIFAVTPRDLETALRFKDSWNSAFGGFIQRWGPKPASLLIIAAAFAVTAKQYRENHPDMTRAAAALLVHVVLFPAILVNLLKLLSGRIRPVYLDAGADNFTAFFHWSPGLGDFSFPSGHVAMTTILAPCVMLLFMQRRRVAGSVLGGVMLLWAGVVAYGRVMYGAHYLTDVLFSFGFGMTLAPFSLLVGDAIVARMEKRRRRTVS